MLLIMCEIFFFLLQPHYRHYRFSTAYYGHSTDSLQTLYSSLQTLYRLSTAHYRLSTDSLQPTTDSLQTLYSPLQTLQTLYSPLQTLYRLSTASYGLATAVYGYLCHHTAAVLCSAVQCCAEHRGCYRLYSTTGAVQHCCSAVQRSRVC